MVRYFEAIGEWMDLWDAARQRAVYRWFGAASGLALGCLVLLLPEAPGLTEAGRRVAAVTVVMAAWWVGGVFPLAVTALVPIVVFPLLGIAPIKDTAAAYLDPLNLLMLGGFVLGHAMEKVGLHRRLTGLLVAPAWVRASPRRVLLALMVATALLSAVMSNTATALMMLPLATSLSGLSSCEGRERTAFPLGVAYAASIGGVATVIGTPPNAVLAGTVSKLTDQAITITFAEWLVVGVPFVVLALPAAWWSISTATMRLPARASVPIVAPERGPFTPGERTVLVVVAAVLLAWIFRAPIDLGRFVIPGWGAHVPGNVDDAWVAMVAALALFLLPGPVVDGHRTHLIRWRELEQAIPWSVILLLGGGFALAEGIRASGVSEWLAGTVAWLGLLPTPVATLVICAVMVVFTEFTSNTAATQIAAPLMYTAAIHAGVEPLVWMVPATVAASCGFMMPAGTAPNAIATEAGGVRPGDMAYAGFLVNGACILVAAVVSLTLAPLLR